MLLIIISVIWKAWGYQTIQTHCQWVYLTLLWMCLSIKPSSGSSVISDKIWKGKNGNNHSSNYLTDSWYVQSTNANFSYEKNKRRLVQRLLFSLEWVHTLTHLSTTNMLIWLLIDNQWSWSWRARTERRQKKTEQTQRTRRHKPLTCLAHG